MNFSPTFKVMSLFNPGPLFSPCVHCRSKNWVVVLSVPPREVKILRHSLAYDPSFDFFFFFFSLLLLFPHFPFLPLVPSQDPFCISQCRETWAFPTPNLVCEVLAVDEYLVEPPAGRSLLTKASDHLRGGAGFLGSSPYYIQCQLPCLVLGGEHPAGRYEQISSAAEFGTDQ